MGEVLTYNCTDGFRVFGSNDNSEKIVTMTCIDQSTYDWPGGLCESKIYTFILYRG